VVGKKKGRSWKGGNEGGERIRSTYKGNRENGRVMVFEKGGWKNPDQPPRMEKTSIKIAKKERKEFREKGRDEESDEKKEKEESL